MQIQVCEASTKKQVSSIMSSLVSVNSSSKVSIGFSVKDILDLPSIKPRSFSVYHRSDLHSAAPGMASMEPSSTISEASVSPNSYPPIYYCENPYTRWLPPADMFTYTTSLCKCTQFCCATVDLRFSFLLFK